MFLVFVIIFIVLFIILSLANVFKITKRWLVAIWTLIIPHSTLLIVYIFKTNTNVFVNVLVSALIILLFLYLIIGYNISPLAIKKTSDKRVNILLGGRNLLLTSLYVLFIQSVLYILLIDYRSQIPIETVYIITDAVITAVFAVMLYLNGFLRIAILSRRLNIFKKVIFFLLMWIPFVNLFIMLHMCHLANIEFAHEEYKINQNLWRVDSKICETKYPLVMLHGVGFRDLKYLNYWGRIPKELVKNGATVYYGNQEAWGTIESNAEDIKKKILEIKEETGVEKVNIIAHSKGGLDARYTISKLGMEDYVASLTTISTPHRGSFVMDFAYKLPEKLLIFIGKIINKNFKMLGDTDPDFTTASKQFLTPNAIKFNEEVLDSEKVYYQSYATVMSHLHSDYILTVPFIIGRLLKQKNDGLVSPESAKWGKFKGVLKTTSHRGISHGDIIDLRRNDYKGFDAREFYVNLVAELKKSGF